MRQSAPTGTFERGLVRAQRLATAVVALGLLLASARVGTATAGPGKPPGSPGKGPKNTTTTTTSTTVPPEPGETLLAAGDIASCASVGDEATAALLAEHPDGTVITLGDNVYDSGTPQEFSDCYDPSWGAHRPRTRPSPGNHDYTTPGGLGYYNYFGDAAGDPTRGYYSFEVGDWHVIALNSNCSFVSCAAGMPQETWLRADLVAHADAPCTLAYWHHPRFSSGTAHGSSTTVAPLWQALYDANADLVLSGHEHNYERFAPLDPAGNLDPERGIREFVAGTGGRSHYTGFQDPLLTGSEVHDGTTWGLLELTLKSTSYDWNFVPIAGGAFTDSGTGTCH